MSLRNFSRADIQQSIDNCHRLQEDIRDYLNAQPMRLRQAVVTLFGEAGSKIFEDREFAKASLTSHDSQFQKAALAVFYLHWGITEEIAHLLASLLTPGNHDESQKMAVLLLKRFHTNTGNQAAVFILRRAAEDKKLPEEVRKACLDALSGM